MKHLLLVAACATALVGCASSPDKIAPSYVSPLEYSNLDCDQIRAELVRVSDHVREVSGVQARAHTRDEVAMGVGIVVFWPALFFLMEGDRKEELGRLKGEYEALDDAAIHNKCPVAYEIRDAAAAETARKLGKHQRQDSLDQPLGVPPESPSTVAATVPAKPVEAPTKVAAVTPAAVPTPAKTKKCRGSGLSTPGDPGALQKTSC